MDANALSIGGVRAFLSRLPKIIAFSIYKPKFIVFNTSLYNTPNIKTSIFLILHLNILYLLCFIHFLLLFLTLPLSLFPTVSPSFSTRSRSFSLSLIFALKTSIA